MNKHDLSNQRFGLLTVIERAPQGKFPGKYWKCVCECGAKVTARANALKSNHIRSCGCSRKDFSDRPAFKQLFVNYRCQAQSRGLSFELTIEEFEKLTALPCFYCGVVRSRVAKKRNSSYRYNGIDRYNNSEGYTNTNCVSCCAVHNHMKSDMSHQDFLEACRSVVEHFDKKKLHIAA